MLAKFYVNQEGGDSKVYLFMDYPFLRVKGFGVCFLGNFGLLLVAFLIQSQSACSRLLIILGSSKYLVTLL